MEVSKVDSSSSSFDSLAFDEKKEHLIRQVSIQVNRHADKDFSKKFKTFYSDSKRDRSKFESSTKKHKFKDVNEQYFAFLEAPVPRQKHQASPDKGKETLNFYENFEVAASSRKKQEFKILSLDSRNLPETEHSKELISSKGFRLFQPNYIKKQIFEKKIKEQNADVDHVLD